MWTVSEWIELQLFSDAVRKKWHSKTKDYLWALHPLCDGPAAIGVDTRQDLYIAKFRCDNNLEWHGYPVHPRDHDIPPEDVLERWRKEDLIDKTEKRRIQTGKFRK
ncbi:hypothetical protein [Achromobacter mucicolens]|uniref:hypothetical protein n=1 Tax=Achromobacter mucicolens TaxID=1389922 RepID=UPI0028A8C49A|nr:hypothetical protein [Achromobacter mucicolens]